MLRGNGPANVSSHSSRKVKIRMSTAETWEFQICDVESYGSLLTKILDFFKMSSSLTYKVISVITE